MEEITLYQFSQGWGLPNPSPFCMKLEGYLKLTGLEYSTVVLNDPRKAPKGKLPYIKHNGKKIADSNMIIDYLKLHVDADLDSHLNAQEAAIHYAMRVMLDEQLYFVLVYNRWADEKNWIIVRDTLFAGIPKLIRGVITGKIRNKVVADLEGQGIARHKANEVYSIGIKCVQSLSEYLGDKEWFGGNKPCTLDVCAVSYLANFLKPPTTCPVKDEIKSNQKLLEYTERALNTIFNG